MGFETALLAGRLATRLATAQQQQAAALLLQLQPPRPRDDTILGRPRFGDRQPDTDRMDLLPPNVDPRMLEFDPKVYNPGLFDPNRRTRI